MTRIVPHQQIFDRAKSFDKWGNIIIYLSSILSVALIFLGPPYNKVIVALNAVNCVFITVIVVFDALFNYIFFEADKAKRLDFIDNSMGTDFSGARSQGYFTNENLAAGLYKMAVNCFENSFFSSQISAKMITAAWVKFVLILIIFVFSAALGEQKIVNLLFQLSLPILLFQQALKITLFYIRVTSTYESFLRLFNDFKQQGNNQGKDPEILKIILDYQTTLAWGAIPLSDKLFNKNNNIKFREFVCIDIITKKNITIINNIIEHDRKIIKNNKLNKNFKKNYFDIIMLRKNLINENIIENI